MNNIKGDMSRAVMLLRLLGDLGDGLAAEADPFDGDLRATEALQVPGKRKNKRRSILRWGAVAACAVLAVGVALFAIYYYSGMTRYPDGLLLSLTEDYGGGGEGLHNTAVSYKNWEYMTVEEKYKIAFVNSEVKPYSSCVGFKVDPDKTGEKLGEVRVYGYKHETDEIKSVSAAAFSIEGIDESFAVAVKFRGDENCYFYMDRESEYTPDTLADVIRIADAASADEVISELIILYESGKETENYSQRYFRGLELGVLTEMLFSDPDTALAGDYDFKDKAAVQVGYMLKGNKGLGNGMLLSVTEDGYIAIPAPGEKYWCFYIGKDKTDAFFEYVLTELPEAGSAVTEPDAPEGGGSGGEETPPETVKHEA